MGNKNKETPNFMFLRTSVENILNLRHIILRPGLPPETAHFDGDEKPDTYHFVCYEQKQRPEALCCVSYYKSVFDDAPTLQLRGMATKADFQGKGLGKMLLAYAEKLIFKETGMSRFWCNARMEAVPFYEKQGWVCYGEEFMMPGVGPHVIMTKGVAPF